MCYVKQLRTGGVTCFTGGAKGRVVHDVVMSCLLASFILFLAGSATHLLGVALWALIQHKQIITTFLDSAYILMYLVSGWTASRNLTPARNLVSPTFFLLASFSPRLLEFLPVQSSPGPNLLSISTPFWACLVDILLTPLGWSHHQMRFDEAENLPLQNYTACVKILSSIAQWVIWQGGSSEHHCRYINLCSITNQNRGGGGVQKLQFLFHFVCFCSFGFFIIVSLSNFLLTFKKKMVHFNLFLENVCEF